MGGGGGGRPGVLIKFFSVRDTLTYIYLFFNNGLKKHSRLSKCRYAFSATFELFGEVHESGSNTFFHCFRLYESFEPFSEFNSDDSKADT